MGDVVPVGSKPNLAELAYAGPVSTALAVTPEQVLGAIAAYERGLAPLCLREPDYRGKGSAHVRDSLKLIGMKLDPRMEPEQAATWLMAVTVALADFPPRVISRAAGEAIRVPMRFLNEVDGVVRAKAEELMKRHRLAVWRLQRLHAELGRESLPLLTGDPVKPMSLDDYRRLSKSELGRGVLSMGLSKGYISQEVYDAAMVPQTMEEDDG